MKIEWTKDMTKRVLIYVVSGIGILAAYFILINLKRVSGVFAYLGDILRPFIIAAIFAYIVNGPMMFFERLFKFTDRKKPPHAQARSFDNYGMGCLSCGSCAFLCNHHSRHQNKHCYACEQSARLLQQP